MTSYDILGDIAVIKGEEKGKKQTKKQKLALAKKLLKGRGIKTVVEKSGNVKGRLRTIKVKHVAGEKNLIAIHKENNSVFKFDIEKCYFSSRLSNERKEIALKVKKEDRVLVMFAGVGIYPIVINKIKKPAKIVGVEIGKDCCKYFKENLKLNKMVGEIDIIQGDVKKKVNKKLGKFDVVVMARPNLSDSFLKQGFSVCKKGTRLFYYGFYNIDEEKEMIEMIKKQAKENKKQIKILKIVRAGDIAPYKFRYRVEIKVLK